MEIITPEAARKLCLPRYFTGLLCKHGHIAERYVSTKICVECGKMHSMSRVGSHLDERRKKYAAAPKSEEFKEAARLRVKMWRDKNLDRARASSREYHRVNRHKLRAYQDGYREENRDLLREKQSARKKARWESDPLYRLKGSVSALIRNSFTNKGYSKSSRTHEIIGCDWEFFFSHIERQFLLGMTWDNRSLWHIDHIVPLATAVTEADVLALNHFTNLRPLWGEDNQKKRAKITHLL